MLLTAVPLRNTGDQMVGHVSVDELPRIFSIVRPVTSWCDPTHCLDGPGASLFLLSGSTIIPNRRSTAGHVCTVLQCFLWLPLIDLVNVGLCFLTYASKPSVLSLELYHRIRCTVLNKEHLPSPTELVWRGVRC